MDIERFKRLSIPKIEAGKMTKVVRDVIKEVRTNKQNVYEKTSENLLPLTDKIDEEIKEISKFKKTDEAVKTEFDFNAQFSQDELDHLQLKYYLQHPNEILKEVKNKTIDFDEYSNNVYKISQRIKAQKGNYKKNIKETKIHKH